MKYNFIFIIFIVHLIAPSCAKTGTLAPTTGPPIRPVCLFVCLQGRSYQCCPKPRPNCGCCLCPTEPIICHCPFIPSPDTRPCCSKPPNPELCDCECKDCGPNYWHFESTGYGRKGQILIE